jgi:4,5-dihydroxyphthalate decarboxylase
MKEMSATKVTLPWPEASVQDAIQLMGEDFWRYGVAENARDIETLGRYSFEQGLATRKLSAEEIFHPSVFEISKV